MGKQDWNQLGNDIKDMVQDAINSQDFSKLNQGINRAINGAMDGLGNILGGGNTGGHWEIRDDGQPHQGQPFRDRRSGAAPRQNQWAQAGPRFNDQRINQPEKLPPGPYKNPSGLSTGGYIMAILGGTVAAGTGFALFVCLMVALFSTSLTREVSSGLAIGNSILLALTGVFGATFYAGIRKIGLARRFRKYVRCIQGRGYCQLEELARSVGRSEPFVKKDVKKMLDKGMFLEGHLDKQETCLITTNQAYNQYKTAQRQLEERQQQERAVRREEKKEVPPEVQEVLDTGNTYLNRIRKCNDLIPGREISEKISRMELIIKNIFKRAQAHPEVVPDLKQMMDYYLPTTVKLLDAYAELDAQPVQGENIASSKREIEQTLDTLNQAFEKLLDSIFKDTAWDVSTDISVLQTLLAQEGLAGDDFRLN